MTGIITSLENKSIYVTSPFAQKTVSVGQQIEGSIISKSSDGTSVQIFNQEITIPSSTNIVENPGQNALFEVIQSNNEQLNLKYLSSDTSAGSISDEVSGQKPATVVKDYQQMIQQSILNMDSVKMAEIQTLVKEAEASIEAIAETMTDNDVRQMLRDGIDPEKTSLEIVAKVLKNNKALVREEQIGGIREAVDSDVQALKESYSDEEQLKEVATHLKEANMPIIKKNVDRLVNGLNTLEEVKSATSSQAMQILDSQKGVDGSSVTSPTVDELYKNIHTVLQNVSGLAIEPAEFEAMVTQHLEKEGIEPTSEAIAIGTAMVERGIAITEAKIQFVQDPSSVMQQINTSEVLNKMINQIENAANVTQVTLPELSFFNEGLTSSQEISNMGQPSEARIEALTSTIDLVNQMTDAHMVTAVLTERSRTLGEAVSVVDEAQSQSGDVATSINELEMTEALVQFKKELSVIQLKMTLEAAIRLEKQGIQIDTAPIEKVVENLEATEALMRDKQWQSYSSSTTVEGSLESYKDTMAQVEQVALADTNAAARLKYEEGAPTLNTYVDAHQALENDSVVNALKAQMAADKYDGSMTEVRWDLGDRIETTFDQIAPMLEELALPETQSNIEAVEALAKNAMPITLDNILEVQILQEKVQLLAEKMTPVVVVEMTQAGINPMDMDLDELMAMVTAYEEEGQGSDSAKISEMILGMDQEDQLTSEERQSLIGIYRTMDTVVRSEGAATGFMVKNDLSLTMNNMFEAAKYIRKTGQQTPSIQANVDDGFGLLESVANREETLREQVNSGIEQVASAQGLSEVQSSEALKTELMDIRIRAFVQALGQESMTNLSTGDTSELIKDMPLEEVTALMDDQAMGKDSRALNAEKYLSFIKANPDFLKTMVANKIPMTFENFSKAIEMNQDSFTMLHEMESMIEAIQSPELKEAVIEKLSTTALQVLQGSEAYDQLEEAMDEVEHMLKDASESEDPSVYKSAASAKASVNHTQLIQVTEDYYQIPVFMNQEVTQLNMYILNEASDLAGEGESKILMSFEAGSMGKVQALMTLNGNEVSLQLQSTYPEDQTLLQSYESTFEGIMGESNYTLSGVRYERFAEKEPIEVAKEVMNRSNTHQVIDGHIEWSV